MKTEHTTFDRFTSERDCAQIDGLQLWKDVIFLMVASCWRSFHVATLQMMKVALFSFFTFSSLSGLIAMRLLSPMDKCQPVYQLVHKQIFIALVMVEDAAATTDTTAH